MRFNAKTELMKGIIVMTAILATCGWFWMMTPG